MDESVFIKAHIILDAADQGNTISRRPDTPILRLQSPQNDANGCRVLVGAFFDHDNGLTETSVDRDVIAFSSKIEVIQMESDYAIVKVNRQHILSLPDEMSKEEAVVHLAALLQAASIVTPKLDLTLEDIGKIPRARTEFERFVIVGGETPLGAAIVQVLSRVLGTPRIHVTAVMEDQEELFQRVTHLMALGAVYAIDGAFPDLKDHLGTIRDEDCQVSGDSDQGNSRLRDQAGNFGSGQRSKHNSALRCA